MKHVKLFEEFDEDDFKTTLGYIFLNKKYKEKRSGEDTIQWSGPTPITSGFSKRKFPPEAVGQTFFIETGVGYEYEVKVLDNNGKIRYRMIHPFHEPPFNESRSNLKSASEFEDSYHYDNEKEAKSDLKSSGYYFKGYIIPGDGFEHIWLEQWERSGEKTPIARLLWLDNVSVKPAAGQTLPNIMQGAQVTFIQPEHPKYHEAQLMKFGEGSKSYPRKD